MKECTEMSALVREHARAKLRKARRDRSSVRDMLRTDRRDWCSDPVAKDRPEEPPTELN